MNLHCAAAFTSPPLEHQTGPAGSLVGTLPVWMGCSGWCGGARGLCVMWWAGVGVHHTLCVLLPWPHPGGGLFSWHHGSLGHDMALEGGPARCKFGFHNVCLCQAVSAE